jgi:sulfate transport system permease protein
MPFPRFKQRSVLPGFGLTFGLTLFYLGLIVLIPLSSLFLRTVWSPDQSIGEMLRHAWTTISDPRVIASAKLTFGTSAVAATFNAFAGFIVAWMLVRYDFPGRRLVDAVVDLPFAMPTAVSGLVLTLLYSQNGWYGRPLSLLGIKVTETAIGVAIALTFIGLPFVVRTLQPALQEIEPELEEASASLGASRWQTFRRVIFPTVLPALLTGFSLAFARALGEFGSVVFIAGNQPFKTEILPLLIFFKLDEHDYAGATAIASATLIASFAILLVINGIQYWASRRQRGR